MTAVPQTISVGGQNLPATKMAGFNGGLMFQAITSARQTMVAENFGAVGDGVTINDAAIEAINQAAAQAISAVDPTQSTHFGLIKSNLKIVFTNEYLFNNTLILWPGVDYVFAKGSVLKANQLGQRVVRTPTTQEFRDATGTNYFDRKGLSISGRGLVDCDNKASIGVLLDTLACGTSTDLVVARCTYRKYSLTCDTDGSNVVNVSDPSNVEIYDTVEIDEPGRFYSVLAINGNSVTLDRNTQGTTANVMFRHRAVGVSHHQCQQGDYAAYTTYCDIGEFYGKNVDGVECTDMELKGESRRCNIALVSCGLSESFGQKTLIKCYEENAVFASGDGSELLLYVESLNDADADTITPPSQQAPVTAAGLRAKPLIDVLETYSSLNLDIIYPMNRTNTTWRRLIRNAGGNTKITRVVTRSEDRPVNPDRPGDFAFAEQNSLSGQITLEGVTGPTNLSTIAEALVIDENGARPANYRASWSAVFNSRTIQSAEAVINYVSNVGARCQEYRNVGESFSRFAIGSGGIFMSDGTKNPQRVIRYQSGVLIDDWLNIPNTQFFRIQKPNGNWGFLWLDDSNGLRVSGSEPANRNTDGVLVGSQA